MKVVSPYTAADAKGLLKSAIRDPNPVVFLENEILYGKTFPVPKLDDYLVPIGKAKIARPGKDVTIVAWSIGMTWALEAAEELAKKHIFAEVIDLRTLWPWDQEMVFASLEKTKRLMVVHEAVQVGGFGAEIAATVAEHMAHVLVAPIRRLGAPRAPISYAKPLEDLLRITPAKILATALSQVAAA